MKLKVICSVLAVALSATFAAIVVPATGLAENKPAVKINSFVINNKVAFNYYNKQLDLEKKLYEQEQKRKQDIATEKNFTKVVNKPAPKTTTGNLRLSITNDSPEVMARKINNFLTGTPMEGQGSTIVEAGIKNNIAPSIIAAIAMQESSGGQFMGNSYNAWGRKAVGGGWDGWSSWNEAINNEAHYLARYYLDEGLNTIEEISYKYCPSPRGEWESGVRSFQNIIANE